MYTANDVRKAIQTWDKASTGVMPVHGGGKLAAFASEQNDGSSTIPAIK